METGSPGCLTGTLQNAEVLIVGGGPAGLCLADRLQRGGRNALVLEASRIGDTWARVPRDMRLVSPWWTNALRWRDCFRFPPLAKVRAADFLRYLEAFARSNRIAIIEGARIIALELDPLGWRATATDGRQWCAPIIVLATGYFSNPRGPKYGFRSDGSLPMTHVAEISDYDSFAEPLRGRTVLLVGKRVSAGQFMLELAKRGVKVVLSANPPVEFRRAGVMGWLRDQIYFFWEAVRIRMQPELRANSYPIMDGGETERLVRSGTVRVIGTFEGVRGGRALAGGLEVVVDHVVLATGYLPAIDRIRINPEPPPEYLDALRGFRIEGLNGLYVLGLDQQMNFLSRYLRGIRSDAGRLALEIIRTQAMDCGR